MVTAQVVIQGVQIGRRFSRIRRIDTDFSHYVFRADPFHPCYPCPIGAWLSSYPLLYYLATHPGKDITLDELAAVSDIEDKFQVKRVLMDLEEADLVQRDVGRYVGMTDPVLADYIARMYKDLFEGLDLAQYRQFLSQEFWRKLALSQVEVMGSLNRAIGELGR